MSRGRTALLSLVILTGCGITPDLPGVLAEDPLADVAPGPTWRVQLPSTPLRVAAIDAGDAVLAGEIGKPITLGTAHLESGGSVDLFVSRVDDRGRVLWAKAFGGPGREVIASVAAAGEAMAIAGTTEGGLDLGGGALGAGAFVAKLDGSGRHVWSKAIAGATVVRAQIDGQGDVVALIRAEGPIDLGDGPIAVPGGTLVAKLGPRGERAWIKTYGAAVAMKDVAVTRAGDVIAVGRITGRYDFGGGVVAKEGRDPDAIIVRYRDDGTFVWNDRLGDSDSQEARVVAVGDGSVFVHAKVESDPVMALYAYAPDGQQRWMEPLGGKAVLASDGVGDVLYGTRSYTSGDTTLGMIDKLGHRRWERTLRRDFGAVIDDLTVTATGLLIIAGHGEAGTNLGDDVILRPAEGTEGFVAGYPLRP